MFHGVALCAPAHVRRTGMLSRDDAEAMLRGKSKGSFLVRVSMRIWGYTLSFVDIDRCKHFLVDASQGGYNVFGTTRRSHLTLKALVEHHSALLLHARVRFERSSHVPQARTRWLSLACGSARPLATRREQTRA